MDGGFGEDDVGKERERQKEEEEGKALFGGQLRCLTNLKVMRQFIT